MSYYPTEEEEFELLCNDEMEIERKLEQEIGDTAPQLLEDNLSQKTLPGTPIPLQYSSSSSVDQPFNRQLNRKLFDSPYPNHQRISSTPFSQAPMPSTSTQNQQLLSQEIFRSGFGARKRCLEELFGDIDDIDDIDDRNLCEKIIAKRHKTEEEIDLEMIERILELRKQRVTEVRTTKHNDLDRLEALQKFKEKNLSNSMPKYPFIPIRSDSDRIYVRFHSEDFEAERLREIQCGRSLGALMSQEVKEQMWANAQKMVGDRMTTSTAVSDVATTDNLIDSNLWVDKYRPKKYLDLLSDESTNRNLLKWLKMWDKIVFQRDVDMQSLKKQTVQFQQFQKFRRKERNLLKTDYDEHGRPTQKIALLCGPPGLGNNQMVYEV